MADELNGSPILAEVLGDALPKLEIFHTKLEQEGEPRGLIGPRDVDIISPASSRRHVCRIMSSR